jgi:outer membrane lipoprotein-sorting protein
MRLTRATEDHPARFGILSVVFAAAFAMLSLAGCIEVQEPPTEPQPIPNFTQDRSMDLTQGLAARQSGLTSLETDAIMEYTAGSKHLKAHEELTVLRPDNLKVEARSPFGVALVLPTRGNDLQIFNPSKNEFMQGEANAETLNKYVRIPMMPRDAVDLLLGLAPSSFDLTQPASNLTTEENNMTVLSYTDSDGSTRDLGFDDRNLVMVRVREAGGSVRYRVDYADYHDIGGIEFPYHVSAEFPASQSEVSFRYRRPIVNGQIPVSTFVLTPAPGASVTQIGFKLPAPGDEN